MKNIFRFLMAAVIFFGAVSCAKEDISSSLAGGEVEVTFTANLPELGTRAYADGANANLLRCWVYDANGSTEDKHLFYKEVEQAVEGSRTFTFTLPLIKGMTYDFVLWADKNVGTLENPKGLYDVTDGIVTVDYTENKVKANDNNRDAFYGFVEDFDPLEDSPKFTLIRPFAQINAATSEKMEDITANGLTLVSSSIEADAYTQFDIKARNVVGNSQKVTLAAALMPYMEKDENGNPAPNKLPGKETYTYLAMGYLLAPQDGMVSDVTFCFNGKKGGADFTVGGDEGLSYTNVPLKQNYRTNILGQLLTKSTEIEVEIKPGFGGDAEDVKVFSGIMNEPIEIKANGTYIFDNLTVVVDNEDAVNIADNLDNVVISILGNVHLESKNGSGIGVEGSSALTLKGGNITARSNGNHITAKGNGNHAFGIGGNNANITLDGVTVDYACGGHIQPLFENDLKYGKSEPEGGPAIGGAEIKILNSTITKVDGGSKAAAIGAQYWQSTNILIEKSTILEANGGNASAGIGGSRYAGDSKYNVVINIKDSNVTATGGQFGAGIGSGYDTHCNGEQHTATNNINIDAKSTVYAKGGKYAAGIGTGFHAAYLTGAIETGDTITANAGDETFYKAEYTTAQNIGYGVMDPTREFSRKNATVTYKVNGQLIEVPFPRPVAIILGSENATEFYSTTTLAGALETSKNMNMPIVRLIADVEVNEILTITHSCTLDLNDKTLTGTANRLIRVSENEGQVVNVTIKNGTIVNTANAGRCVETRSGDVNLTLEGVKLIAENGIYPQPFTVGGSGDNIVVTIKNSTITTGDYGYGITTFNPVAMTIENSTVSGYGALNIKVASSSLGSAGSVFDIKGSTIVGTNNTPKGESNSFSTFMCEDSNVKIKVDAASTLKAIANTNDQAIFGFGNEYISATIGQSKIDVAAGATLVGDILGFNDQQPGIGSNIILLPAEYAEQLSKYDVSEAGNGQVKVEDPSTKVANAAELAAALAQGGIVVLTQDIELAEQVIIPAGKQVKLNLNGQKISGGFQEGSTYKHIYPINNYGELTITGGTIEGRGIYNQDGAKLTIEGATVNALDFNGGACVWSYGTGEVYLNNATMTGNTGIVSSEGYVEINGGAYTCKSGINDNGEQITNPTYNIRAYNGLKITDGTFTSRHGVISVGGGEAVIEGGNYTIQFAAATTSHVVYVFGNSKVTINNGNFISDNSANKADSGVAAFVKGTEANLTINNGTFVGMNGMVNGNVVLYGGKYNTVWNYNHYDNIKDKLADDYKAEQDTNGFWVVSKN